MLTIKTYIETNLTVEQAINAIKSKLKPQQGFWSRNLITVISDSNPIHGLVNMPAPISDPFKNHVNIKIKEKNNFSSIRVKLHFGIIVAISVLLFPGLIIYLSVKRNSFDFASIVIGLGFSLFLFIIFRIKLNWDNKRVINWIINECNITKLNK